MRFAVLGEAGGALGLWIETAFPAVFILHIPGGWATDGRERGWGRCSCQCSLHCGVEITVSPVLVLPGLGGVSSSALLLPVVGRGPGPAGVRDCAGGGGTNDPMGGGAPCGTCSSRSALRPGMRVTWYCWPKAGLFLGPCLLRTAHHGALITHVMLIRFFFFQWSLASCFRN